MKNIMKLLMLISLVSSCAFAQDAGEGKKAAEQNFENKYPNALKVKWEIDDHANYEAQFEKNGTKYRADFDRKGNWIETETKAKWKDLPEAVKKQVKKEYDKNDIAEIELVDHHAKGTFYDVEIKRKGKNYDMEFKPDGTRIN